jgi:hypothetical protein
MESYIYKDTFWSIVSEGNEQNPNKHKPETTRNGKIVDKIAGSPSQRCIFIY